MTHRPQRVATALQAELARLIQFAMHDPRLGFITITGVDVSPDLRHARVHLSVLGDEARAGAALEALDHARGWLRHELAHRLEMRRVPDLDFRLDRSGERGRRIEAVLTEIEGGSRGARPASDTSADEHDED